jgi:hypothetical protein
VLTIGTIAAQPQFAIDPSQVKAFGETVIEPYRIAGHGDRSGRRHSLAGWVVDASFGLVAVLQSEVRRQLDRAQRKLPFERSLVDRLNARAVGQAETMDACHNNFHPARLALGLKLAAAKQSLCMFIQFDPRSKQISQKLVAGAPADMNEVRFQIDIAEP